MQIIANTTPAQAAANPKLWKAAQDFESMTLSALLQPMFDTVDLSKSAFGGGEGEAAFKPMLVQELARSISRHGGLGLAAPVFAQMLKTQEAKK